MKKYIFLILITLITSNIANSAEIWDDFPSEPERNWEDIKPVTNQEFEKAIETLSAGKKKVEEKQRKKKIKKLSGGGTSLHNSLNPNNEILEQEQLKPQKPEGQLLNIPVNTIIDGKVVDKGFYNVYAEKDKNGEIYLSLYQSQYLIGKLKGYETKNDYDSESIDFVKMLPYDENYLKIVFGCMDFNAYAYIRYIDEPDLGF